MLQKSELVFPRERSLRGEGAWKYLVYITSGLGKKKKQLKKFNLMVHY